MVTDSRSLLWPGIQMPHTKGVDLSSDVISAIVADLFAV